MLSIGRITPLTRPGFGMVETMGRRPVARDEEVAYGSARPEPHIP